MILRSNDSRATFLCVLSLILALFMARIIWANDQVALLLTSSKDSFVLHEPLDLRAELVNASDQTVRIFGMEKFSDENMPCLFLEITTPDGRREERKTCFSLPNVGKSPLYKGEPLGPGERFGFEIFPTVTYFIDDINRGGWTFPLPGEYGVRLVYEVEAFRERLWKPEGNRLYSNEIRLCIEAPTPEVKEILEAYWRHVIPYGEAWDGKPMWGFDVPGLKSVLEKYPNDPMIKYIHFALLNEASFFDLGSAKNHAEILMSRFPDFRSGLVRGVYGQALIIHERKAEGLKKLADALRVDPFLENNEFVMRLKINTEEGNTRAYWRWRCDKRMDRVVDERGKPKEE